MNAQTPASSRRVRLSQRIALLLIRLTGWKLVVNLPPTNKFVIVGAPHTSNWDLWHALLIMYGAGIRFNWVGKDTIFWWPLGILLRRLRGLPVNRRSRTNFVQQVVNLFAERESLAIAIAPEGTRSRAEGWRTGFYYIALGAEAPIALGYVDYATRTLGVGDSLTPTGDIDADFARIQAFYADKQGRWPALQGKVALRRPTLLHENNAPDSTDIELSE
jgi:1-acyl-sn-glycerol-3-phosphate acyltransferase